MRFVEYQVQCARLRDLFLYGLRSTDLSPGLVFAAGANAAIVVDRVQVHDVLVGRGTSTTTIEVEWDDGSGAPAIASVDGPDVGFEVSLYLYMSRLSGRGTANPTLTPLTLGDGFPTAGCAVWVTIEASLTDEGRPQVTFRPTSATLPDRLLLDEVLGELGYSEWDRKALVAELEGELVAAVPVHSTTLPLGGGGDLPLTFLAGGVAIDDDWKRLAIRFQTTPHVQAAVGEWRDLFAGDLQPALRDAYAGGPDDEWAVLLERAIVQEAVTEGVRAWIDEPNGGDVQRNIRLGLRSGPEAVLQPDSIARIDIDFWWDVQIDAPIQPEAHAHVPVALMATVDGALELTSVVQVTLDEGDDLLLGWIVDTLAPVVGRRAIDRLVSVFAPSVSTSFSSGFVGSALLFPEPIVVSADLGKALPGGLPWMCHSLPNHMQVCVAGASAEVFAQAAALRADGIAVHLGQVLGLEDALVARGSLTVPLPPPFPQLDDVVAGSPRWVAPEVPCARSGGAGAELAKLADDPLRSFGAAADAGVVGTGRLVIQAATVVSADPDGVVVAVEIDQQHLDVRVRFRSNEAYEAARYPFSLLVQTNAGARLVRIDPLPPMTDQLAKELVIQAFGSVAQCFKLVDPFYVAFHRLNPKLAGDPALDSREAAVRLWGLIREHLADDRQLQPIPERIRGAAER